MPVKDHRRVVRLATKDIDACARGSKAGVCSRKSGHHPSGTGGLRQSAGSLLSGVAVDAFTTGSGDNVTRNWYGFWMTSAAGAFVIFLLVAAVFKSRRGIRAQQEALATGD